MKRIAIVWDLSRGSLGPLPLLGHPRAGNNVEAVPLLQPTTSLLLRTFWALKATEFYENQVWMEQPKNI